MVRVGAGAGVTSQGVKSPLQNNACASVMKTVNLSSPPEISGLAVPVQVAGLPDRLTIVATRESSTLGGLAEVFGASAAPGNLPIVRFVAADKTIRISFRFEPAISKCRLKLLLLLLLRATARLRAMSPCFTSREY